MHQGQMKMIAFAQRLKMHTGCLFSAAVACVWVQRRNLRVQINCAVKKKKQMYFITMALQPVLMIIVNLIVGLENLAPNSILHRIFKLRRWQTTVFARRRKKTSNLLARHSTEFTLCVNVFYQSARCFGKWQKDKAVFSQFHFESSNPAHVFFAMESEISSGSTSST